jgi:hypothetical protein
VPTVALSEMLTELRARGGYRRSTSLTDSILTEFLNTGIDEVHDLVMRHAPDSLVTSADLTVTAGASTTELPPRFYKTRKVCLLEGTREVRLRAYDFDDETQMDEASIWDSGTTTGRPKYTLQAGSLRLTPATASAITIRLWYLPTAQELDLATDEYEGTRGQISLVYEHALRLAKARDRMGTSTHDQAIAKLEKRLHFALDNRDTSEPEHLPDLGRSDRW